MSIGPDLFGVITPPAVWITLHELESPEHDERAITLRVKAAGRRSVSCSIMVSKYSPEVSILQALRHVMGDCETSQKVITVAFLKDSMQRRAEQFIEPF